MPQVLQVFHAPGTKWKLVYSLYTMRHWRQLTQGYRAIMVADDDLAMDTCVISRYCMVLRGIMLIRFYPGECYKSCHGSMSLDVQQYPPRQLPTASWQLATGAG